MQFWNKNFFYPETIFCLFLSMTFIIWTHGVSLMQLFKFVKRFHNFFKFAMNYSQNARYSLDVLVIIMAGGIETVVNSKPADKHTHLHFNNFHPFHIKQAIPVILLLDTNVSVHVSTIWQKKQRNFCIMFSKAATPTSSLVFSLIGAVHSQNSIAFLTHQIRHSTYSSRGYVPSHFPPTPQKCQTGLGYFKI